MKEIREKIGIVGFRGIVGWTVYQWFLKEGYRVFGYSRTDQMAKKIVNEKCDVIFICVPTPFDWIKGKYNGSLVPKVLKEIKPGRIVIIKSTVMIGTTDRLQKRFPDLKILFNPEFLSERTCDADFSHPDRQFVGYTKKSYSVATAVLNLLPESPYSVIMPAKEAELLKYINNLHGVLEVMESNHYYDVCRKEKLDYKRVIRAAVASKWVGPVMGRHYRNVWHKGYRGFGGKCFPKDLASWLEYCRKKGIDSTLMKATRQMNKRLLKEQGMTEEEVERK